MQRRTIYIILAVAVVLTVVVWMTKKKRAAIPTKQFPMRDPSTYPSATPRGHFWNKFGKPRGSRAPGSSAMPSARMTRMPSSMPSSGLRSFLPSASPASRVAIPTIKPEVFPPFTLGPVPNGVTRVPEPPTMQPVADAGLVLDGARGGFTLYDDPAGAHASMVGGLNVPAVQNPWDLASWQFLKGADVGSALGVVQNLFPSFPITTRSAAEGPKMSGAVTLVYDKSNKVTNIVRD